jgi:hypothetical protein
MKLLARVEIGEDLAAQRDEIGTDDGMVALGFSKRYLEAASRMTSSTRREFAQLASELGWPDNRPRLNIRFLAEKTGRLDLYDFLYHATSRFVHFKVKELLRRAWGNNEQIIISSRHFAEHW